jgi:hypothetical protein
MIGFINTFFYNLSQITINYSTIANLKQLLISRGYLLTTTDSIVILLLSVVLLVFFCTLTAPSFLLVHLLGTDHTA